MWRGNNKDVPANFCICDGRYSFVCIFIIIKKFNFRIINPIANNNSVDMLYCKEKKIYKL